MPATPTKETVLFIAPSAYPLGGVQTWLDYLLPGLESKGYRAVLALTSGLHHNVIEYLASHALTDIELISAPTGTTQGRVMALEQLILKVNPNITINVNIIDIYQAVNNLRQRGLSSTRLVTSIHGIQKDLFAGINSNSNIIDSVISTNRLTQKLINSTTGVQPGNSFYAPYGVEKTPFNHKKHSQNFTIAYAGRIEEQQKRINDLLQIFSLALDKIDNIKIIIAGSGEDTPELEKWLRREAKHATKIEYLGVINPSSMTREVYSKADALLLTSEWETGPIVAWEAMNNHVCLISSKYVGSVEEGSLIDGENCLLFDIGDVHEAVNKIQLVQNKQLRTKLTGNAKRLIETKYSHEKSIEAWATCLEKITSRTTKSYCQKTLLNLDNGRLNSLMYKTFGVKGVRFLERVRQLLRIHFKHENAGGEWPHSYPSNTINSIHLDRTINRHDK